MITTFQVALNADGFTNPIHVAETADDVPYLSHQTADFKFAVDGVTRPLLSASMGNTYIFDVSSQTLNENPFVLSLKEGGTHNEGDVYSTGVTYYLDGIECPGYAGHCENGVLRDKEGRKEAERARETLKGVSAETLATRAAKRVRTKAFAAIDKMVAFAVAMRKKDDVKVAYTTSLSVGLQVAVDTVRGPSGSLSFEIGTGKTGVILPPGQADAEWSADWVGPTVRFTASVRKVDVEVTVRIMDYSDSHGKPGDADFVPKRLSYVNVRVLLPNDMGMRKVALTAMVLRSAALKSLVESIVTESYRLFSGSSASPTADKEAVSKYAFWETFLQDLIVMVETSGAFSIAPQFVKSRLGIVARVLIFNTDDGRTLLDQRQTTVMPFIVADIFGAVTDKSEFRLGSGTKLDLAVGGGFTVPLATFLSAETARKEGIAVVPEPIAKLHK